MPISIAEFETCLRDVSFPLAVATSGGADSLALLLLTHKVAQQKGQRIIALTIDHGLRDQSKNEALFVRQWAQEKGIEHIILEWDGIKPLSCLQEKAREARYHLLLQWCKEHHIPTLLLGHHQQDQEETFWLRLSAGSGLDGLGGMKRRTVREGVVCLRPLLEFSKERLLATLKAENHAWIEDPSNHNLRFFRGRFRSFLKEEGLSQQRLNNVMEKLQIDAAFIQVSLQEVLKTSVHLCEEGYISIERNAFEELHPALSRRLLPLLMQWYSGVPYPPRSSQIETILKKIKVSSPFTAGGIYWLPHPKEILLLREVAALKEEILLSNLKESKLWDHRFWIDPEIQKNVSRETLLAPLGAVIPFKKEISSSIPPRVWPTLPALWVKGEIVSVPHLCYTQKMNVDFRRFFYLKPLF
jgi:tRNA(Ile)-lysidine synthase